MASTTDDAVEGLADQFEEAIQGRGSGGGGKKGGKQSKSAGSAPKSGGGGDSKQRESQVSRALSRLLRHQALNAGIVLDKEGYAPLDKVVSILFFLPLYPAFLSIFSLTGERVALPTRWWHMG